MKKYSLLALLAVLLAAPAAFARPACSLATLNGRFVVSARSDFTNPVARAAVGVTDFDGHGHVRSVSTISVNGATTPNYVVTGTYTVNANCAFTQSTTDANGATGHAAGVIGDEGRHILLIGTDPDDFATGDAFRLDRTTCEALPATRYAARGLMLFSPNGPETHVSMITAEAAGRLLITDSTTDLGSTVSTGGSGTAFLIVHPDCTVSMATSDGSSHYTGVARVTDRAVELYLVGIDPSTTVLLSAQGTSSERPE